MERRLSFNFPRTSSPRRRFVLGACGIAAVLLVWFALTLRVIPVTVVEGENVHTGRTTTSINPLTGEAVEIPEIERVERTVTRREALVNPPALETPANTFRDAWLLLTQREPSLLTHIGHSSLRILLGFVLSAIVAVPLGVAMGLFPDLRATVMPIVSFLRPLPSISWVPLAMIWLGAGELQKLAIVFMGSFSAALIYTIEATLKVDPDLIKAARNLGAAPRQLLWRVLLPAALPNIVSGLKVVMAIGWTCVISAEIVGTQEGLGALIWLSKETSNTAAVLVGMVSISSVVLVLDLIISRVERRLMPWAFLGETR
jgi:taurine transport system permease protein